MGLLSIRNCIQRDRLRWFEHVERMDKDSWVKKCREMVEGHRGIGRPLKTWDEVIPGDLRVLTIQHDMDQHMKFAIN